LGNNWTIKKLRRGELSVFIDVWVHYSNIRVLIVPNIVKQQIEKIPNHPS